MVDQRFTLNKQAEIGIHGFGWAEFLPRCEACAAVGRLSPHPRARKPAIDSDYCPDCGAPCGQSYTVDTNAVITSTGGWFDLARLLLAIADSLRTLAKRLEP